MKPLKKRGSVLVLIIGCLLLSSTQVAAHESFGLAAGVSVSSVDYPLLAPTPLGTKKYDDLDSDESSCLNVIFENLGTGQDYVDRKNLDKKARKRLIKTMKRARFPLRSRYWGRRFTISNGQNKGFDISLNGRLSMEWAAIDSRRTCLIFFDDQLVAMELRLNEYNMSFDFPAKHAAKANSEHAKQYGYPTGYQEDGYWAHEDGGWFVNFENYSYLTASLTYRSAELIADISDVLIEDILGVEQ